MIQDRNTVYYRDCKYFRGDIPCKPHKDEGVHCMDCSYYAPKKDIVLIIKLGAAGDVIRTTPLLSKIYKEYPDSLIWWLTYSPELIPQSVDKVLPFNNESLVLIQAVEFNTIINLDKDYHACGLASTLKAKTKTGFLLLDGKPIAANELAEQKYLTGLYDDVNQANEKTYLEEMFEICGWKFNGEEYIVEVDDTIKWEFNNNGKPLIGLNTGCGDRWTSRLWKDEYWKELINKLTNEGYFPVLLGGKQEHEKNLMLSVTTGAYYPGHYPLKSFISLMNQCDLVVTAVTMGLHIAIGLKKPVVLMNNIFNPKEFELYGRGEIIQPEKSCHCYFKAKCTNNDYFCMDSLKPESIFNSVEKNLKMVNDSGNQ